MKNKSLREILESDPSTTITEWRTENSLLKFIKDKLDKDGLEAVQNCILPDQPMEDRKGFEDVMNYEERRMFMAKFQSQLSTICSQDETLTKQEFYRIVNEVRGIGNLVLDFTKAVSGYGSPEDEALLVFAKDLMTKTDRRNAVKFGIAILGRLNDRSVVEDIKILGLRDEFSREAAVALARLSDDPVTELWELAKKQNGNGRTHTLKALSEFELSDEIRDWMIWEGYKNKFMDQQLSVICATGGRLHERINKTQIDQKLYKSASDMIVAILGDDSYNEMYTYKHAAITIGQFIAYSKQYAKSGSDYYRLHRVKEYLTEISEVVEEHEEQGWNADRVSNCLIDLMEILNGRDWTEAVNESFKNKDINLYLEAYRAGCILGLDKWKPVWERIKGNPDEGIIWYDVIAQGKSEHFNMIMELAQKKLEREIAANAIIDTWEILPGSKGSLFLEAMAEYLGENPGKGEKFILTALGSTIDLHREMAMEVLERWDEDEWSPEIKKAINH